MNTATPTTRRPRRDAAHNRATILTAATEALAADPHASIDTIARAGGLSRRAFYGHFDDRDALLREVIAAGAQRFNDIAVGIDAPDARVALARTASRLWREASHVQALASIALDDAHVHETAAALEPMRSKVSLIVSRGQQEGMLRTDVAAPVLGRLIEETARTVIIRMDVTAPEARSLAVRAVLSIAGLSWREADTLLSSHPEIFEQN
ncbi:TetR/AcrR family transcriptional regulator (plasmid) [Coraliomargarita sp. W4R53]